MTFGTIQARVQQLVQDTSGSSLLNIQNWINDGQQDFQSRLSYWPWLLSSTTFATAANDDTYSLASDVDKVINLRDETNGRFMPEVSRKLFQMVEPYVNTTSDTAQPTEWYRFGMDSSGYVQIKLWPVPASVYTVRYDYYKLVSDLSSSADVPVIPVKYMKALIAYACKEYFAMKQDPMADYYAGQYEIEVQKAIMDTEESDQQVSMVPGKPFSYQAKSVADDYFMRL